MVRSNVLLITIPTQEIVWTHWSPCVELPRQSWEIKRQPESSQSIKTVDEGGLWSVSALFSGTSDWKKITHFKKYASFFSTSRWWNVTIEAPVKISNQLVFVADHTNVTTFKVGHLTAFKIGPSFVWEFNGFDIFHVKEAMYQELCRNACRF